MTTPLWFYDLAVYFFQLAILILAAGLMVRATGLLLPRARLAYWQIVLLLGLLLPVLQPWQTAPLDAPPVGRAFEAVAAPGSVQAEAAASSAARAAHVVLLYKLIALGLVAGFLLRLLWLAVGLIRLRRSRRAARALGLHPPAEELKSALEVSPAVLVSERLRSPITFGWRSPLVLLPAPFVRMEEGRQRAILCHEFLHVRRRDWRWHIAEEILRAVFWFHFAVAWLIAQIRLAREQLVDQEVVAITGSRRDYLDALFEVASGAAVARPTPAPPFLSERYLKRRVALIIKEAAMSRNKLIFALSASFGALLAAGTLAVVLLPLGTSAAAPAAPQSAQVSTIYKPEGDVEPPHRIHGTEPLYTRQARKNHVTGTAVFSIVVDSKGSVTKVEEESKPLGDGLDESATETLRTWKFSPAMRKGVAVPVQVTVEVNFKLFGKRNNPSQKPAADPPLQSKSAAPPPAKDTGQTVQVNQEEIERQVADALKQSKAAQLAAEKLNRAEVQQALAQAKIAQQEAAKINWEDVHRQMEQANQAMAQAKLAQESAAKINQAELRQAIAQAKRAMDQAKIAQQAAAKINLTELRQEVAQAEAALKQAQEAQSKAEEQLKKASPTLPSSPPPPAAPEAEPAPPSPPPSAAGIGANPAGPPPPAPAAPEHP